LNGFEVVKDLRVVTKLLVSLEWSAWEWVRHAEPWRCVHMSLHLQSACCTIVRRPYFASHTRSVSQVCVCVYCSVQRHGLLSCRKLACLYNEAHTQATHPSNTLKRGLTHLHSLTPQNPYLQYAELTAQDNRCFLFVPLCACSFVCGPLSHPFPDCLFVQQA
jgi:hypothetical protein